MRRKPFGLALRAVDVVGAVEALQKRAPAASATDRTSRSPRNPRRRPRARFGGPLGGASPTDRSGIDVPPVLDVPNRTGPEHPSGQADQGDNPKRRCRFILSGLPQALFQLRGAADIPSASRLHTPTETNPPWSCGRPRGGRRATARHRQKAHQTGMGECNIALQKPLNALPGRCRLGQ